MKLKRFAFILIIFLLLLTTNCFASSDLELNTLNYNVTLNSDGSAYVTETWDINIEDTNTLFKTFEIDNSKYSSITNVSVVETTNGLNKSFFQIFEEKYHVNKDSFYSLVNSKGQFEIAWGVNEDDSSARRTFNISYTIVDAVKNYSDASEFYWQFISEESAIPAENVTGTITIPNNVINSNDFRVWAHGPLNGNIYKTSNNNVSFEVADLHANTMLEVRVVTPTYVFPNNPNISSEEKLSSILSEEQAWADKANQQRAAYEKRQKILKIITIAFFVLSNIGGVILAIVLITKIFKYKKQLETAPNYKPSMPSKYYRDIPNNNYTPAEAAFLYYFKTSTMSLHISSVFSATMLNLALKKYLSFEKVADKKDTIKVILNSNVNIDNLSKDERNVFELLQKVSSKNEFTMKEFERYCKNHTSKFNSVYNSLEPTAKKANENYGNYDSNITKIYENYTLKIVGYVFLFITSIFVMWANIIPSLICIIYCSKLASRYNTLTQKGVDEKEKWQGLKNYMEDFSTMKEKEVPELILWEKYLVYATAFGIADKVLKQLKVVYPQLSDENYLHTNGYTYLYFMAYSNNTNFVNTLNTSISNTYSSINYSSGSGSGGGFSGGGGFGGGGGRNGRTLEYFHYLIKCYN